MFFLCFSPEGVHGLREELVEGGVAHAVDGPLGPDAFQADGGVAVLRDDRLPGLAVDAREAEHRVARQLKGENYIEDFRARFILDP